MASIIGLLVLFLATLTLGGCAGMPYGADLGASGYGYGGSCPQPYGGSYPQPYGASMPVPVPMYQGYATAPPVEVYVPQPQPYYAPGVAAAPLPPQADPTARPWSDHRERYQAARIRQGRRDGSLTPHEAQRLSAEQRHIRGAEARMSADGNFSPRERGRLNAMQNRASQDIYRGRHNGMVQPGAAGPHPGNGPGSPMRPMVQPGAPGPQSSNVPGGPMSPTGQHQINGAQMQGPVQTHARPTQTGVAPSRTIGTPPGQ